MAEFTANALQVVALNNNVAFTDTPVRPCPKVRHREGSGIFTLKGGSRYLIMFSANISGATAGTPVSLAIAISGEPVQSSNMISTPAVADDLNNVATSLYVDVPPCCCYNIAVENTGTTELSVQNANLIIIREDLA